jgi:hypothetical protein
MLDTLIVQDTLEVNGIVIKRGANIGFAIVSQEIQGAVAELGEMDSRKLDITLSPDRPCPPIRWKPRPSRGSGFTGLTVRDRIRM